MQDMVTPEDYDSFKELEEEGKKEVSTSFLRTGRIDGAAMEEQEEMRRMR